MDSLYSLSILIKMLKDHIDAATIRKPPSVFVTAMDKIISKRLMHRSTIEHALFLPICIPKVNPSNSPRSIKAKGVRKIANIIEMPMDVYKTIEAVRSSANKEWGTFFLIKSFLDIYSSFITELSGREIFCPHMVQKANVFLFFAPQFVQKINSSSTSPASST